MCWVPDPRVFHTQLGGWLYVCAKLFAGVFCSFPSWLLTLAETLRFMLWRFSMSFDLCLLCMQFLSTSISLPFFPYSYTKTNHSTVYRTRVRLNVRIVWMMCFSVVSDIMAKWRILRNETRCGIKITTTNTQKWQTKKTEKLFFFQFQSNSFIKLALMCLRFCCSGYFKSADWEIGWVELLGLDFSHSWVARFERTPNSVFQLCGTLAFVPFW